MHHCLTATHPITPYTTSVRCHYCSSRIPTPTTTPTLQYTVSLFLAYPFAALLRALPGKHLKHLASLLGGLFLAQWVFGPDWIHSLVSSAGTYLICALAPRKYCPVVVLVWVMGYMTGAHVYQMYTSYLSGVFDFTGTQVRTRRRSQG